MPEWVYIVNQVAFPIFVAVVLLWRVDMMHVENVKAIAALTDVVNLLRVCISKTHFIPGGK